jgi:hypothetical protein
MSGAAPPTSKREFKIMSKNLANVSIPAVNALGAGAGPASNGKLPTQATKKRFLGMTEPAPGSSSSPMMKIGEKRGNNEKVVEKGTYFGGKRKTRKTKSKSKSRKSRKSVKRTTRRR